MHRRTLLNTASAALLGTAAILPASAAWADWPERPITMIVPWGAGGGTDATGRIIASLLEEELGQPVNVVNRTGGGGLVGHQTIASAEPDGYTIGMLTTELSMLHHQGLTDMDWTAFTPIALVNTDPAGLHVSADAPYEDAQALLDAIEASSSGEMMASGTGVAGIWHLAMAGLLQKAGLPADAVTWVPSEGAAPAMQELAAGGVDIVTSSIPEARSMIDAGEVKSLAVMADERNPVFPDVPTLEEATGIDWTSASSWRGVGAPKGLPDDITGALEEAVKTVHDSQEFRDFMAQRGFGVVWADQAGFEEFLREKDEEFGQVMEGAGLTQQ